MTSEPERIEMLAGEVSCAIRVSLYRTVPRMPGYPLGIIDPIVVAAITQAEARGREIGLREAAAVADNHEYGIEIGKWMEMTKNEHSSYACRSVAMAILNLIPGEKA